MNMGANTDGKYHRPLCKKVATTRCVKDSHLDIKCPKYDNFIRGSRTRLAVPFVLDHFGDSRIPERAEPKLNRRKQKQWLVGTQFVIVILAFLSHSWKEVLSRCHQAENIDGKEPDYRGAI